MIRGEARTRIPMAPARGPRLEPRFDGDGLAVGEYEDDIEEDSAPRRRTASRSPARRSGSGYTLPSLNLLAAPRALCYSREIEHSELKEQARTDI